MVVRARAIRIQLLLIIASIFLAGGAYGQGGGGGGGGGGGAPAGQAPSPRSLGSLGGQSRLQSLSGDFVLTTCGDLAPIVGTRGWGADTQDLFDRCSELVVPGLLDISDPEINEALEDLAHGQAAASGTLSTQTSIRNLEVIGNRLVALREGGPRIQFAGLDLRDAYGGSLQGEDIERALRERSAAGDQDLLGKWGLWGNGLYSWGDFDGRDEEVGFDFDALGAVVGVDYRFSEPLVGGLAFNYSRVDNDFDGGAGELDRNAYGLSAYGTWQQDAFYVDAIATYSYLDYSLERSIVYPTVNRTARSDPSGDQWGLSVAAGANLDSGALGIDPYLQVNYIGVDTDGARESGAQGLNLTYEGQSITSLTTDLGVTLSYDISTGSGIVTPYLRGEWEHEFENDSRTINARFTADLNRTRLSLRAQSPDRDVFNVGAGVSMVLTSGMVAFIDFDTRLGDSYVDQYALTVGARFDF